MDALIKNHGTIRERFNMLNEKIQYICDLTKTRPLCTDEEDLLEDLYTRAMKYSALCGTTLEPYSSYLKTVKFTAMATFDILTPREQKLALKEINIANITKITRITLMADVKTWKQEGLHRYLDIPSTRRNKEFAE